MRTILFRKKASFCLQLIFRLNIVTWVFTFILCVGFCRLITSRSEVDRAIQKQISRLPREFLDIKILTADALFTLLCVYSATTSRCVTASLTSKRY